MSTSDIPDLPNAADYGRLRGTVVRVVRDRGFGFIRANGHEYFFHASGLLSGEFLTIEIGARVEFGVEHTPKGARAIDVEQV